MKAYLFDVDGVLTSPRTPETIQPNMIALLVSFLKYSIPMGFVSGRGMWWLRDQLIKNMEKYIEGKHLDKKILNLLYVGGEFGVVTATYTNGERIETTGEKFMIPHEIKEKLTRYAQNIKNFAFIEKKQTVFTFRCNFDIDKETFKKRKSRIITDLQKILQGNPEIEILSDRIAINIRHRKANKTVATDNFISWLKEKKISPEKFFVFGDNLTDFEMGLELQKQKLPFEFIYVGEEGEFNGMHHSFPVIITKAQCDEGTLEYLQAHVE